MTVVTYLLLITSSFALLPSARSECCNCFDESCTTNLARERTSLVFGNDDVMIVPGFKINTMGANVESTSLEISGIPVFEALRSEVNRKDDYWLFQVVFPYCNISTTYKSRGNVNGYLLNGNGALSFNMKKLQLDMIMKIEITRGDDGFDHLNLQKGTYWFSIENVTANFENLNSDNPEEAANTKEYMNKEWKILWIQFGRYILDPLYDTLIEKANKYLSIVPKDELFCNYDE